MEAQGASLPGLWEHSCPVHDSVAVHESEGERERERVTQILGREDLLGFCASPVVAARATPVRQAPSQVDFTKSAKKSAENIRPDLLQMLGNNKGRKRALPRKIEAELVVLQHDAARHRQ